MASMWTQAACCLAAGVLRHTHSLLHRHSLAALPFNQSINQSIYIVPWYRGACYDAVMPNQREMS